MRVDEAQIAVEKKECLPIALWPRNVYGEGDTFIEALAVFVNQAETHHVNLSFPVGGYFDSLELMAQAPNQPQHFFSIDPMGMQAQEEGAYLVGYTRGYYGELGDLPERMAGFAKDKGITVSGPVFAIYLFEETSIREPADYLVQVCASVAK